MQLYLIDIKADKKYTVQMYVEKVITNVKNKKVMNPIKINDEILVVENFFTDEQISDIRKEILSLKDSFRRSENKHFAFDRVFLDDHYKNTERYLSPMLTYFIPTLYSKELIEFIELYYPTYSFQTLRKLPVSESQLTVYKKDFFYKPHTDNSIGRVFSFVLPIFLDDEKPFEGGTTTVFYKDEEIELEPIHNRLMLFSTHVLHAVNPVTKYTKTDLPIIGRITLNGHINWY